MERAISTLNGGLLKLIDKFIYLGSSISSTESDVNIRLAKTWTAIDRLLIIWKSNLSDKVKWNFFQATVVSADSTDTTVWMHHMDADKMPREKARCELHKNAMSHTEQILETTHHESTAVWPLTFHL